MVYAKGKRDPQVATTEEYCRQKGNELRTAFLHTKTFNADTKRNELKNILRINEEPVLKKVHQYAQVNGWSRFALETDDKLIPVLLHSLAENAKEFAIVTSADGKEIISPGLMEGLIKAGSGIAVVDLSGIGEMSSAALCSNDSIGRLRTLSKSCLWLGKTVMGEWVKELNVVTQFIHAKYKSAKLSINGSKEAGLAGLYLAALVGNIENVTLQYAPLSYLFDNRDSVEYFSTAIHLPGILNWGDVSLAAALTGKNITSINPVSMSGQKISEDKLKEYKAEFEQVRKACGESGKTVFK